MQEPLTGSANPNLKSKPRPTPIQMQAACWRVQGNCSFQGFQGASGHGVLWICIYGLCFLVRV